MICYFHLFQSWVRFWFEPWLKQSSFRIESEFKPDQTCAITGANTESVCFVFRWQRWHRSWTSSPLRQLCRLWASVAALQLSYHTRYCQNNEPIISALAHHFLGAWTRLRVVCLLALPQWWHTHKKMHFVSQRCWYNICHKQYNEQLRKQEKNTVVIRWTTTCNVNPVSSSVRSSQPPVLVRTLPHRRHSA